MLREEFKNHILWDKADEGLGLLVDLEESATQDEKAILRRIEFLLVHVSSYRALAGGYSEYFNEPLLAPAIAAVDAVNAHLRQRASGLAYRSYTDSALSYAENILVATGSWPQPYAKGGQSQQLKLFYEELRNAQLRDIELMEQRYRDVIAKMDDATESLLARKSEVEAVILEFQAEAATVATTVDSQKDRIDKVIDRGIERVNQLTAENSEAFELWTGERRTEWDTFSEKNKERMKTAVDGAASSLVKLKQDEKEFGNLTAAITGQKLAKEFNDEAASSRFIGLVLYALGFVALALAAAPLFMLMSAPPEHSAETTWQHFAIRLSLGLLGASAATVLIRLGARFITGSTASKRMALELQTFGPFLANVSKETVDAARVELIDRAFGKSYAPLSGDSKSSSESNSDVVPVTALSQLAEIVKSMR